MAESTTKATTPVAPKFNFDDVDISAIDPDKIQLGTEQQDCVIIAQTYERGAHSTPTEAAVFATFARTLQNNKQFSVSTRTSLKSYLGAPEESAGETTKQAEQFAGGLNLTGTEGTEAPTDHIMESLNIGTQQQSTHGSSFGDKLLSFARDCIPCNLRMMAFLELHPNVDLLGTMENYIKNMIDQLSGIASLLNNFDIYGDFCELLNLLSFMCIPDLQRIIALLMALFMLEVPSLDGLIGMLQALIAPIFAPIFMAITSLLDQFTILVTNPLDCVVDAINAQLNKLSVETPRFEARVELSGENPLTQISTGLYQLQQQVSEGIQQIRNKLGFYVDQVQAMLNEMGGNDAAYLQSKLKILQMTRMISFVTAIITALSKGHAACSSTGKTPDNQEIDNFFQNFLNPNSPFNIWIDDNGNINIDERIEGFQEITRPPNTGETLPEIGNVLQFEGEPLLDSVVAEDASDNARARGTTGAVPTTTPGGVDSSASPVSVTEGVREQLLFSDTAASQALLGDTIATRVNQLATQLLSTSSVVVPCKQEMQASDVSKVNEWISQLNKA